MRGMVLKTVVSAYLVPMAAISSYTSRTVKTWRTAGVSRAARATSTSSRHVGATGLRPPRCFLTSAEMDAVASAADLSTWCGRHDHVLLIVALRTGLRLSELTGLRCRDVVLGAAAHVKCLGWL